MPKNINRDTGQRAPSASSQRNLVSHLYALEASESVLFRVINVIAQGRPDMETTSLA